MPGALSRIYSAGLWKGDKCCRCATTPLSPSPRGGKGDRRYAALVPNDTAYASQASAIGITLGAPGRDAGARAACRSSATALGYTSFRRRNRTAAPSTLGGGQGQVLLLRRDAGAWRSRPASIPCRATPGQPRRLDTQWRAARGSDGRQGTVRDCYWCGADRRHDNNEIATSAQPLPTSFPLLAMRVTSP